MKLGDIRHRRAVQSLGRYDIGLPAAQARATTGLIDTALDQAQEIERVMGESEFAERMANHEIRTNELEAKTKLATSYKRDYLESLDIEVQTTPEEQETLTFREDIPAHEVQDQVFQAEYERLEKETLGSMRMPTARLQWERVAPQVKSRVQQSIMVDTIRKVQDITLARYQTALDSFIKQGSSAEARIMTTVEKMANEGLISRVEEAEYKAKIPAALEKQDLVNFSMAANEGELRSMAKMLRDTKNYDGDLLPKERKAFAAEMIRLADQKESERHEAWETANASRIADAFVAISDGQMTREEIELKRSEGFWGPDSTSNNAGYLRAMGRWRSANSKANKDAAMLARYQEGPIRHDAKGAKEIADRGYAKEYEDINFAYPELSEQKRQSMAIVETFKQSSVLPSAFKDMWNAASFGDIGAMGRAVETYNELLKIGPNIDAHIAEQLPAERYAELHQAAKAANAGMVPQTIMDSMMRQRSLSVDAREMRSDRWREENRETDWVDDIASEYDDPAQIGWTTDPEVPLNMAAQAEVRAKVYYDANMDYEDAKELAIKQTLNDAGNEIIGTPYFSPYPMLRSFPEFHGHEEELQRQARNHLISLGLEGDEEVRWWPVMYKNTWKNGAPVYQPMYRDTSGMWVTHSKGWQPDSRVRKMLNGMNTGEALGRKEKRRKAEMRFLKEENLLIETLKRGID